MKGSFDLINHTVPEVMAYHRVLGDERWLVVANLSGHKQFFKTEDQIKKVLLNNIDTIPDDLQNAELAPYQAFAAIIV
ncbi:alpha-glucosidase C-terminal domain-containing protein [Lacticaseibacillus pantheris]|uniref:alpha-glucosidase C-terminal domain-containing protein n=1 Tax=Lacticaseibacillus pantheris TaxID=171523 RepID=UPI000B0F849A|nr:alpha-glucosidase C-terminal domain-containing protein [Lacticaseibacillus pantheris]